MQVRSDEALEYLRRIMPGHKALGLLAQKDFESWVAESGEHVRNKYFTGCWIVSPRENFFSRRTCFFVHPRLEPRNRANDFLASLVGNRGFQSMCSSLSAAGFAVIYFVAHSRLDESRIADIEWSGYRYRNEQLDGLDVGKFFARWGGRGRASRGKPWEGVAGRRMSELGAESLTSILLPQLFYNDLLKTTYRVSTQDPYDVDGFIISFDGKVFPIEIKEKFPFDSAMGPTLGVDAGRVLMMLRIALPMDGNAFYIVREVGESKERELVGWKITTLDQIVMKCSWNLQAGGPGMASSAGGAGTQTSTILLPYGTFSNMSPSTFSEENLRPLHKLSDSVKRQAQHFLTDLERMFAV